MFPTPTDGGAMATDEARGAAQPAGLRRAVPILPTADLTRALAHYGALGFETEAWEGGGYGFLTRDGVELHVSQRDRVDPAANPFSFYLYVADADALHAEWAAAGVGGLWEAPEDKPWGLREGRHIDPDGNALRFGSSLGSSEP
jgi:uncharacterized glyoxalase superfamily protein PhnB